MTTPGVVIACRDCRHWYPLTLQAWVDPKRGTCKAVPGNWTTDEADFCALWTERTPPADTPPPCSY